MDRTAVTIFSVTMIVVAGCVVYDVFFKSDDAVDPDYSFMDSPDRICPGMVLETTEVSSNFSSRVKIKVESCENGVAECLLNYRSVGLVSGPLSDFDPDNFYFNYVEADQLPVGLNVTKSGEFMHVLQGSYSKTDTVGDALYCTDYQFDGFKLILDRNGKCIHASGKASYTSVATVGDTQVDSMNVSINCSTSGDSYTSKNSTSYTRVMNIDMDELFPTFVPVFSEEIAGGLFSNAIIGQYHSTYYNEHVTTYHAIGDCDRFGSEADVIITVYDDYVIGVNGDGVYFRVSVYKTDL